MIEKKHFDHLSQCSTHIFKTSIDDVKFSIRRNKKNFYVNIKEIMINIYFKISIEYILHVHLFFYYFRLNVATFINLWNIICFSISSFWTHWTSQNNNVQNHTKDCHLNWHNVIFSTEKSIDRWIFMSLFFLNFVI